MTLGPGCQRQEAMSEATRTEDDDGSYGELLGEYFSVAADIAPLLDELGRPEPDHREEYDRLRVRKLTLRSALDDEAPDHEGSEIEAVLDEALSDSNR